MQTYKYTIEENSIIQFKKRKHVRWLTNAAIRKGDLKRATCCEACNRQILTTAHHVDYGKPFDIIWLCSRCHGIAHRKGHRLNPCNNKQTPLPACVAHLNTVSVTFTVPAETFLAIQNAAKKKGVAISKLLRLQAVKEFPVESRQLTFNFEDIKNDDAQSKLKPRVQNLGSDKIEVLQSEGTDVAKVWEQRNTDVPRMERVVSCIPVGYGADSRSLQLSHAY